MTGATLCDADFDLPVASAQVKSCILLAAQAGRVLVELREPGASRDHTERMLRAMGADLSHGPGWVRLVGGGKLRPLSISVPADPSSAALVVACALGIPGSEVRAGAILANPTRCAFVTVLERMGADLRWEAEHEAAGEPIGDLVVKADAPLRATTITPEEVPGLIDEVPALAAVAAQAEGTTVFEGVSELRLKESDRIAALEALLASFGIESGSEGDRFWIRGGRPRRCAEIVASADHRIAMAAVALAFASGSRFETICEVDLTAAEVSFPTFRSTLEDLRRAE